MTSRDFCYWLQGYFEIGGAMQLGEEETAQIKKHLNMVFIHEIDPSMGDAAHQEKLNQAHEGKPGKPPFQRPPGDILIRC